MDYLVCSQRLLVMGPASVLHCAGEKLALPLRLKGLIRLKARGAKEFRSTCVGALSRRKPPVPKGVIQNKSHRREKASSKIRATCPQGRHAQGCHAGSTATQLRQGTHCVRW